MIDSFWLSSAMMILGGFAAGYGVRSYVSHRRRERARRKGWIGRPYG